MYQLTLGTPFRSRLEHGSTLRAGQRKLMRPLDPRHPVHVVLKSSHARGEYSLIRHKRLVQQLLERFSRRFQVRILKGANMGNHLHLVVKFKNRSNFQGFLRCFPGQIAQRITRAKKGQAFGKFWDALCFSRVVVGLRALRAVVWYVETNSVWRGESFAQAGFS